MIATRTPLSLLVLLAWASVVHAQDEEPLYRRPPTDLVVLNEANDSAELELLPDASRVVPNPLPRSGELRARLLSNPSKEIAIAYASIKRLERFPDRLMKAAVTHAGEGEYGDAFDYFARLDRDYPDHPGLRTAFSEALLSEATLRFRAGEQDHALALLGSLAERSSRAPGLADAVDAIGDQILTQRWEEKDYEGVRTAMRALEQQFSSVRLKVFKRWRERLAEGARVELKRAEELAKAGKTREAIRAASGALALNPRSTASRKLVKRLLDQESTLRVGVWSTAEPNAVAELDSPAAIRQARLLGGRLLSLDGYRATGGVYTPSTGTFDVDVDRRVATLTLRSPHASAELARLMLSQPGEASEPLSLLRGSAQRVASGADGALTVSLGGSHPQPAALLRDALPTNLRRLAPGQWKRVSPPAGSRASALYKRRDGRGRFQVIEEYAFDNLEEAAEALRSQEIHLLDRAPPWRLSALAAAEGVRLIPNRLPTIHCLVVSPGSSVRARRELRRAIAYAIPRREILRSLIAGGVDRDGFGVLSAPVPRGVSLSDPLRYGYSDSVEPRPYDPRLGALLLTAGRATDKSRAEVAAEAAENGEPPPSGLDVPAIPDEIRLAHTPTPLARVASEAIKAQLEVVGLRVDLIESNEAALSAGEVEFDLRYAEVTIGEPLVDVWRFLGPGGIAGDCSPPLLAALRRVVEAPGGKQAAAELRELHRVVFAELPVIPLWQTVEHTACLEALTGLEESPVDLYQGVNRWELRIEGPQ